MPLNSGFAGLEFAYRYLLKKPRNARLLEEGAFRVVRRGRGGGSELFFIIFLGQVDYEGRDILDGAGGYVNIRHPHIGVEFLGVFDEGGDIVGLHAFPSGIEFRGGFSTESGGEHVAGQASVVFIKGEPFFRCAPSVLVINSRDNDVSGGFAIHQGCGGGFRLSLGKFYMLRGLFLGFLMSGGEIIIPGRTNARGVLQPFDEPFLVVLAPRVKEILPLPVQ